MHSSTVRLFRTWGLDMQVILSPMESIADTYRALLPDDSGADFQRILDLKVRDCSVLPRFRYSL